MNAFALAGLLYIGAGVAVLPATILRPPARPRLRTGGRRLAIAVLFGGAIAPVLPAAGLARTPAATASLLLNLELVATVILAAVVFHEHIGHRVATSTALVVTGGVVLTWAAALELRLGAIFVAGACMFWAIDNCVTAGLDELAPHHITMAKAIVAGTANLALGLIISPPPSPGQVLAALTIGVIGYGLSITMWVTGARDLGAARGQLIFAIAPFRRRVDRVGRVWANRSPPHNPHENRELVHAHPHVPDLHHRHEHP